MYVMVGSSEYLTGKGGNASQYSAPVFCRESGMKPWSHSVDFLVVGSGAAGMAAAVRAHDLGGETLVIENAPH
jgi:hypothetical protein